MLQGFYAPELYAPGKKVYEMLKGEVVGGPSLVFSRKHEAGKTALRWHRFVNALTCQRVLGYDANTLYPSTIPQEMPCGPGKVVHYESTAEEVDTLVSRLKRKMWFGFAEVDIKSPKGAVRKFEEFPPLFYNSLVSQEVIPEHMKEYLETTKRTELQYYKICGWLAGEKICFTLCSWNGISIMALRSQQCIEPSTTGERKSSPGS